MVLANAAASLDVTLRELTTDVGVDLLSFGGTKNGLLFGDAVVILGTRIQLLEEVVKWWDRCHNVCESVGLPPKDIVERARKAIRPE